MAIPNPPKALDGHCSTVWNDQLFVLSSNSFQSVGLKEGAKWNQEATGKAVTGAACATVQQGSDPSTAQLYVIGGTSDDAEYSGLQRYTFSSKSWETLKAPVADLRNRLNHSAIYIPRDNKILVYAGSPASTSQWVSTSTFTILASEPYTIDSHPTTGHKGANNPILGTWNASHVLMTGGTTIEATNYLFDAVTGWSKYPTDLPASIPPGVRGVVIQGTDGSKILQTYDASVSPNKVSSLLLQRADGSPAATGQTLGGSSGKRDLSASNWPAYNSTDAPAITRSDFSVATNAQGLVVLAGGNPETPVSLFNQNQNSWVNAASFFNSDPSQQPLVSSSSSAAASSTSAPASSRATSAASSTAASSSSPAATVGTVPATIVDDATARQEQQLKTQLGIILGICGAIFLFFILLLLYLRARKRKQEKGSSYVGQNEGGRMSFADRGASFMKEAEGSQQNFYPTADRYSVSQRSPFDQANAGKHGASGGNYKGYNGHKQKGSYESTKELVEKDGGYMAEPMEMTPVHGKMSPIVRKPAPTYNVERAAEISAARGMTNAIEDEKDRRKRSSGWSRYFATSQPADNGLAHMPSAYRKDGVDPTMTAKDPAYTSIYSQAPSIPAIPSQLPSASLMPPLNIDFTTTIDGQRLSKVASSNPSYFNSQENLPKHANTARIEESARPSSSRSHSAQSSLNTLSSDGGIDANRGPQDAWTPMTVNTDYRGQNNSRPTSSMYTASVYGERPRGGQDSFYPGSNKNKLKLSYAAAPSADWGSLNDENLVSLKHALANRDTMHSNVTVFPEPNADGDGYTATTRQPSQKSSKSAKSARSEHNAGSGMAGLTRTVTHDHDKSSHMTLFPRTVEIKQYPGAVKTNEVVGLAAGKKAGTVNNDTSWVNLESR